MQQNEQKDHPLPEHQQADTQKQEGNNQQEKLVPQEQPLKNNDHDVDPSDPRHSSLGHR